MQLSKQLSLFTLITIFCHSAISAEIELQDVSINEFITYISRDLEKSVVVGAVLESSVTVFAVYENQQELENLVESIVLSSGYNYQVDDGVIHISRSPFEMGNKDLLSAGELSPLTTTVLPLQNIASSFAFDLVSGLLASDIKSIGGFVVNAENINSLLITVPEEKLAEIQQILVAVDRPVKQVLIEAVIAELSNDDFEAFGMDLLLGTAGKSSINVLSDVSGLNSLAELRLVSPSNLDLFVSMVNSSATSNILSSPNITVLNRSMGEIHVGQNVPFVTSIQAVGEDGRSQPLQNIERNNVGVSLSVKPLILPNGSVELEVDQQVSSVTDSTQAADIITNERSVRSKLIIKNGSSIYLGGLKTSTQKTTERRVPILSRLPGIGSAFRSNRNTEQESTLAVILTAHVL